jgi:NADH:ubiquinone oxidoreductase subunit K
MSTVLTLEIIAVVSLATAVVLGLVITMIERRLKENETEELKSKQSVHNPN